MTNKDNKLSIQITKLDLSRALSKFLRSPPKSISTKEGKKINLNRKAMLK